MKKKKYAIIDIETTGGRAENQKITEIAIAIHDGEKVLDTFETLLNPEMPIPYVITELTGISNEMVADAPKFYEVAKKVVEMTEGCVFVAHNVRFDYSFIQEEFRNLGFTYTRPLLCTVRLSRQAFVGLPSYSLGNLIKHFNIDVEARHRAMADVMATVEIFEKIMNGYDGQSKAEEQINLGIKESKLPQGITLEYLHALPEACGVYYFLDKEGQLLYIGKSKNIKTRVMQHFAKQSSKAAILQKYTAEISYEITGSELVALLLESHEIKKQRPPVNRAQRTRNFPYVIHTFENENGYQCFEIGKPTSRKRKELQVLNEYPKVRSARSVLQTIFEGHQLCQKMLGLETGKGPCFHYHIERCHGACVGKESADVYNERAREAMNQISTTLEESFFIIDKGRDRSEKAVIMIENNAYRGFGYLDSTESTGSINELQDCIKRYEDNPEVRRMIIKYLAESKAEKVIKY